MTEFKIETGFPIPVTSKAKYPWAEMKVGDSFFVPAKVPSDINVTGAILNTGFKFIRRSVDDGVRVWRVK